MRLKLGRTRFALIVAPHPDDETIGAYGLIRVLLRAGSRVHVIIVSDGAASHPGSHTWPSGRLVATRRLETRQAMRRAGLSAACIEHLNLPDSALGALNSRAWRPLARALRRRWGRSVGLLVGPSANDAHSDHVAVANAIARTRLAGARRLAYRVWPDGRTRLAGSARGVSVAGGALAKRSVIQTYRSQTGRITDSPAGFVMSRAELARFARPVEWFEWL